MLVERWLAGVGTSSQGDLRNELETGLFKEHRNTTTNLNGTEAKGLCGNDRFGLNKVCRIAFVVYASAIEPRTRFPTAES